MGKESFLRGYAPVTTQMVFFKMPMDDLVPKLYQRELEIKQKWRSEDEVKCWPVSGCLPKMLDGLLPLASPSDKILVASHGDWATYIQNGFRVVDVDPYSQPGYMAERLRALTVTVVLVEDEPGGQPGSIQFEMKDFRNGRENLKMRYVLAHKESRWEFESKGEPFPFEDVEQYKARRIKDRLTVGMVEKYCLNFGIHLFDPEYYRDGYIIQGVVSKNTKFYPYYPNQKDNKK
jgi:hypothetical protein